MTDFTADYLALRREAGAVPIGRDVLRVRGPDAHSYLQGQLSQDLDDLRAGESTWAFLLQPQGKVEGWLRVSRTGDDAFVLDMDEGAGERVATRLRRFQLRTKWDLEVLPWRLLALRGPEVVAPGTGDGTAVVAHVRWPGRDAEVGGVDLLGPDPGVPEGARRCGRDAFEALRIECGVPATGAEVSEATIPAELGQWVMDASVSFTKGCFTGQELVARIDSRGGNVPRPLRGVVVARNVLPPLGARVTVGDDGGKDGGGKDVGRLTSIAESLDRHAPVALAPVLRKVEVPAEVTVAWEGGSTPARVEALPLV